MTNGGLLENRPYMLDQTDHRSRLVVAARPPRKTNAISPLHSGKSAMPS